MYVIEKIMYVSGVVFVAPKMFVPDAIIKVDDVLALTKQTPTAFPESCVNGRFVETNPIDAAIDVDPNKIALTVTLRPIFV